MVLVPFSLNMVERNRLGTGVCAVFRSRMFTLLLTVKPLNYDF